MIKTYNSVVREIAGVFCKSVPGKCADRSVTSSFCTVSALLQRVVLTRSSALQDLCQLLPRWMRTGFTLSHVTVSRGDSFIGNPCC